MRHKRVILVAAMVLLSFSSYALDHKVQPEYTQKACKTVSEMTLGEKIDYIGGYKKEYRFCSDPVSTSTSTFSADATSSITKRILILLLRWL